MKKMFLINFSLMEKIADKKRGITTEDATAFLTGVELFFVLLIAEFLIIRMVPFKINDFFIFGGVVVIWYFTHYVLRKSFKKIITDMGIRKQYLLLNTPGRKGNLVLSIFIFFIIFLTFFAAGVWTIGGYDKRW